MKVSEYIVKFLEKKDVTYVFGIPGAHVLSVYDELLKSDIQSIQVTHEQSAGFMADVYSRVSHKPGVILTTAGPGVLNVVNATAQAFVESSALFIIGANCKKKLWGKGCYHELKTPDAQMNIFNQITKFSTRIFAGDEVIQKMENAYAICCEGRPRPIFLEIPEDVFEEDVKGDFNYNIKKVENPKPSESEVNEFLIKLKSSKSPIIISGGGVIISAAQDELIEFSKKLNVPITTTIMGKSSCPSLFEYNLGFCGPFFSNPMVINRVLNSDLVIAIGTRFDELATGFFTLKIQGKLIHVDIDPSEFNKNYSCDMAICSDAKRFLSIVLNKINQNNINEYKKVFLPLDTKLTSDSNKKLPSIKNKVSPDVLISEIGKCFINKESIFVGDAGNSSSWLLGLQIQKNQLIITPSGYNSMGFSVPGAIGAKLASPNSNVICLCGDGSFLMTGLELLTAIAKKIKIICIVLHDKEYNMLTIFQDKNYGGRYSDTFINTFNFAEFINTNGGLGILVSKDEDITLALKKASSYEGVSLIEVMIDSDLVPPILSKLKN